MHHLQPLQGRILMGNKGEIVICRQIRTYQQMLMFFQETSNTHELILPP